MRHFQMACIILCNRSLYLLHISGLVLAVVPCEVGDDIYLDYFFLPDLYLIPLVTYQFCCYCIVVIRRAAACNFMCVAVTQSCILIRIT